MNKFEDNITELEQIVKNLELGNATLDECVTLFEKGVKLSDDCVKMLDDAQQKINLLMENKDGSVVYKDFNESSIE